VRANKKKSVLTINFLVMSCDELRPGVAACALLLASFSSHSPERAREADSGTPRSHCVCARFLSVRFVFVLCALCVCALCVCARCACTLCVHVVCARCVCARCVCARRVCAPCAHCGGFSIAWGTGTGSACSFGEDEVNSGGAWLYMFAYIYTNE
jgi:hypothetical protein